MPKRKRTDEQDGSGPDGAAAAAGGSSAPQLSVRQKRVRFKLDGATKTLARAFKLAMGFERQKLGRRTKQAVADGGGARLAAVEAEIAAVKALDALQAARHHLYKTLLRSREVAAHPNLPEEVKRPLGPLATDAPTLNVNARLCKANPVLEGLKTAVPEIRRALGIEGEEVVGGKRKRVRAKDFEKMAGAASEAGQASAEAAPATRKRERKVVEASGDEAEVDLDEDDSDDELGQYADRLASSDEEDGSGADDVEDLERQLAMEGISRSKPAKKAAVTSKGYSLEDDMDISDDESAHSASPEPRKATKVAVAPPTTKSSFLPSLTLGGYISGSGSEDGYDDFDADVPARKNRRGQRARQKIWEQKFGKRANHLQKQPNDSGRGGWDPKRGAVDGQGGRRGGGGVGRSAADTRGQRSDKDTSRPTTGRGDTNKGGKVKHRDDGGPIHPSWEAAKRAKEKKEAPVAFQGKKITFD